MIEAAAAALKKQGFINYFGLQRFGTSAVPTHQIGDLDAIERLRNLVWYRSCDPEGQV